MFSRTNKIFVITLFVVSIACTHTEGVEEGRHNTPGPKPQATPSKNFTPADVAKLKWIEGTWRGMDGDKPFFERYRIEESSMVVDSFTDETLSNVEDTGRFELKNGEFGKCEGERCSAASEITADYVQFVPAAGSKGNNFRFVKQADGTWQAILEWTATKEKEARQKIYKMEPWPPTK